MAHGYQSDSNREAMLRRTAIVLSSLPAPMATRLMNTMGEDSRRAVRHAMTTLSDVDPLERQRALHAFRVSLKQQPATGQRLPQQSETPLTSRSTSAGQPRSRVVAGLAEAATAASTVPGPSPTNESGDAEADAPDSPLAFLGEVDDPMLVQLLSSEHPQAVALVLASLAPEHAARIIASLESSLRRETLSRLGRLGDIPEAAALEVANHFRDRLNRVGPTSHSRGGRILEAILAAMPSTPVATADVQNASADSNAKVGEDSVRSDATDPVAQLSEKLRAASLDPDVTSPSTRQPRYPSSPTADEASTETNPRPPVDRSAPSATGSQRDEIDDIATARIDAAISDQSLTESPIADSLDIGESWSRPPSPFASTDAIDRHLAELRSTELCGALAKVPTDVAILALCGLPNRVTESALSVLPRTKAKQVRAKINAIGSVQLRQIDRAKEEVAMASLTTVAGSSLPVAA